MSEQLDFSKLALQAQQGDKGAMDRLAELASQRLRVYVYRLTLQDDLTQEIVQETLLEMCKVIGNLKNTDRFLPWIYGIATNKLRHFYRSEQAMKRAASRSAMDQSELDRQEGLETLLSQELRDIITNAIESLKTNHRAVLIMRCYDGMSYAEIAESMGCSEFGSRMLFLRAKKALQKQLARNGLGKGSLLAALLFFGKMTSPSEAAAAQLSITAATTKVGVTAATTGFVTSKSGLISLATAGVLAVGTAVGPLDLHLAQPDHDVSAGLGVADVYQSDFKDGFDKRWFYTPEWAPGAICRRAQMDPAYQPSDWAILENADACYYLEGDHLEKRNARQWRPYVLRLPWDSQEMRAFLQRMDGHEESMPIVSGGMNNAFYGFIRNLKDDTIQQSHRKDLHVLQEDVFLSDWSPNVIKTDTRDTMHKRGWTYFRVNGHIDGQIISGRGCMPFVLAYYNDHKPWLRINIGDVQFVDTQAGAWIKQKGGNTVERLESGSFFAGLSKPWMGLHSLDSVRRDAASRRFPFETHFDAGQDTAMVKVECQDTTLLYTIDLGVDVVRNISVISDGQKRGEITFSYLQDIGFRQDAFEAAQPESRPPLGQRISNQGIAWLAHLVNLY